MIDRYILYKYIFLSTIYIYIHIYLKIYLYFYVFVYMFYIFIYIFIYYIYVCIYIYICIYKYTQTDRQIDGQIDRQIDIDIDRYRYIKVFTISYSLIVVNISFFHRLTSFKFQPCNNVNVKKEEKPGHRKRIKVLLTEKRLMVLLVTR